MSRGALYRLFFSLNPPPAEAEQMRRQLDREIRAWTRVLWFCYACMVACVAIGVIALVSL